MRYGLIYLVGPFFWVSNIKTFKLRFLNTLFQVTMHKSYQCEKKLFSAFLKEEEGRVYCYCMFFSEQDDKEKGFREDVF